jgi:hypothetical protein
MREGDPALVKCLPIDVALTVGAYLSALSLRFEGFDAIGYRRSFVASIALALIIQIGTCAVFGLYGDRAGMARRLVLCGLTAGCIMVTLNGMAGTGYLPRSVALLGAIGAGLGIAGVRLVFRASPTGRSTLP